MINTTRDGDDFIRKIEFCSKNEKAQRSMKTYEKYISIGMSTTRFKT